METLKIDNNHKLSAYFCWDGETSIASRTLQQLLHKKHFKKDIESTKNPYLLQRKLEVYYNIEFREICLVLFKDIYHQLKKMGILSWNEKNTYIFENVSQFENILGVDKYDFGWNIGGNALRKKEYSVEPSVFVPVVEHLISYFEKNFHLQPFYHKSLRDIFISLGRPHLDRDFDVKSWKYYHIYQHETRYPNTFMFYIQRCFANYIKYLEDEKIYSQISTTLCKRLNISTFFNFPDSLRSKILYYYHERKIPLSKQQRYTLQHFENLRLTKNEISKMLQFEPCFQRNKDAIRIQKTNPLHPDYTQCFKIQQLEFRSIMEYFLFKLYLFYIPAQEAYKSCKKKDTSIELILEKKFKNVFYTEMMKTMNHTIDARLLLLESEDKEIKDDDKNFLSNNLMDLRNEMKSYLNQKYPLETEMVVFSLEKWLLFWKKTNLADEKQYIQLYFDFFFPNLSNASAECDMENVLFPICFQDEENAKLVKTYLENWSSHTKEFTQSHMYSVFQKYPFVTNSEWFFQLDAFLDLIDSNKSLFGFYFPEILTPFEKAGVTMQEYFLCYKILSRM